MGRAGALLLVLVMTVGSAMAGDVRCMSEGKFYGPGAVRCQAGSQQQCVDGGWKSLGLECAAEGAGPAGMREQPGVPQVGAGTPPPPTVPGVEDPTAPRPGAAVMPR